MPTIDKLSQDYEDKLTQQILNFSRQIESIYFTSIDEISLYAKALKQINFELSPALRKKMEKVLKGMAQKIEGSITNSVEQAWGMANDKNDTIADQVIGDTELTKKAQTLIYNPNAGALAQFFQRVEDGLSLSDRVWNFVEPYRHELEAGLSYGIGNGQSASSMANDLKRYLQEPDKLFRRVRDENGKLQLSRAAALYNPGTGVYRSSYQNAIRLTGTETNIAYRSSDFERWNNMSFVIGIEIKLSPRHLRECAATGGKACDICDDFVGTYPKDFKFTGWHPRCRCYSIPKLATKKQFDQMEDKLLGLGTADPDVKYVQTIPAKAQQWIRDNRDRIRGWKNDPYWIADNPHYTRPLMEPQLVGETQKDYAKRVIDKLPLPGKLAPDQSLYFLPEKGTRRVKLSDIISAKSADATVTSGQNAARRLWAASKGLLSKRDPISVEDLGNGKFKVIDGNSTVAAARLNGWDEILVDDDPARGMMAIAKEAGKEVKAVGDDILARYGGTVTPVNYKQANRILDKVKAEIKRAPTNLAEIKAVVKDAVRLTNVVPYELLDEIASTLKLEDRYTAAKGGRVKVQSDPADYYGYKGIITNFTANGITVEAQVNSPGMMYAKDKEAIIRPIIGDKVYDEIHARTGLEGGKGHDYYVNIFNIKQKIAAGTATDADLVEMGKQIKESIEYYSNFYGF